MGAMDSQVSPQPDMGAMDSQVSPQPDMGAMDSQVSPQPDMGAMDSQVSPQPDMGAMDSQVSSQPDMGAMDSQVSPQITTQPETEATDSQVSPQSQTQLINTSPPPLVTALAKKNSKVLPNDSTLQQFDMLRSKIEQGKRRGNKTNTHTLLNSHESYNIPWLQNTRNYLSLLTTGRLNRSSLVTVHPPAKTIPCTSTCTTLHTN